MNNSKTKLYIIGGIVVFMLIIFCERGCSTYNGMVSAEEEVNKTWGNVQASYQRRFDLIPNLVNTVKGYAKHESSTLENVTNARAGLIASGDSLLAVRNGLQTFNPNSSGPSLEQMEQLSRGFNLYINAVHEAYPTLQASANFMDLQKQLESTENRINTERNNYNKAVTTYDITIRKFPNNIFAGIFGFEPKNQFTATQEAQSAPTVDFETSQL